MNQNNLDVLKARVKAAEGHGVPTLVVATVELREALDRLEKLEELVKEVTFKVGDVVREVGDDEPTGEIIQIKEGRDEKAYVVNLYSPPPTAGFTSITYYADEIELIERPSK